MWPVNAASIGSGLRFGEVLDGLAGAGWCLEGFGCLAERDEGEVFAASSRPGTL